MNKRAEKLMSAWWFFVLTVIAGGIVIGVLIFYSGEVNVNKMEVDILSERILECLNDNGKIDYQEEIFQECGLNKDVIDSGDFYLKVSIEGYEDVEIGRKSFVKQCSMEVEAEHYPQCVNKTEYFLEDGELVRVNVFAGSNQRGKKEAIL